MKNLKVWICISMLIWMRLVTAQEQTFNVNQLAGETITLPHDQNDLTLAYVGIHFDNSEKVKYCTKWTEYTKIGWK